MTTKYSYKNKISEKDDQYVNLKGIGGRLFPTWILANFNKYKLPEIFIDDSDPCNETVKGKELRKYQEFLGKYLGYLSPYKSILLYHGLGSGKTRTAINVMNILYNSSPDWNVFILIKATFKDSIWLGELDKWLQSEEKDFRMKNIHFISYDAPNADKLFIETIRSVDVSKKSMYIIDESHNFIRNVYSNLTTKQGRRALTIYEYMMNDKRENFDTRIILISGSPAINVPYELAIMFNLLKPDAFPKMSESEFNQTYIYTDNVGNQSINPKTKNQFQRRIKDLVSHYIGSTPDFYAKKNYIQIDVPMSEYQEKVYSHFEKIEEKISRNTKGSGGNYKSYTRQACNFVFPNISQSITGETRPRPKDYKTTEYEIEDAVNGDKEKYYKVGEYLEKVNEFADAFDNHIKKKSVLDNETGNTLIKDIDRFKNEYERQFSIDNFTKFVKDKTKKSEVLMELYNCSPKMTFIVFNIMNSSGPVLIYSNYVVMEGLQIFKIYLKYLGFTSYESRDKGQNGLRYLEYHGLIEKKDRAKALKIYNDIDNKTGDISKIIMITAAGAEGLSLNNVRQVHIMEPFWQEVQIEQMIGRSVRQCSHKDLPKKERVVDIFRYKSIKNIHANNLTTDQYIEQYAYNKSKLIKSFLDIMKQTAIDCELNKNHNFLQSSYKCFQFNEKSLFDEQIGPAYKEDIIDDLKINNGLDAENSVVKRIKLIKISAVKQLSADTEENIIYSEEENYWYYPSSKVVYDYKYHYPIGKVKTDENDIPIRLDNNSYIISKMIPIPIIKK